MMQAPRFPYPFLCVQTDEDDGQLIIVRFPLSHITDLIVLCNSVFRQGIADAVRRIHADPDAADLFEFLIIGMRKLPSQLRGKHPCPVEDTAGDQAILLVKLFLGFQVDEKT